MAISPQIVQPRDTGSNALMQLAQVLGQQGQFNQSQAQQASQFDQLRAEQQANNLATQGIEQDKLNAQGVQGGIDFATNAYDKLTSEGQLVKTFSNLSTAKYTFELAKKAGLAAPGSNFEDWYEATGPSALEVDVAGGDTLENRKLAETIANNAETIRVRDEGIALEAERNKIAQEAQVQTTADEQEKNRIAWASIGIRQDAAAKAGKTFEEATAHRDQLDRLNATVDKLQSRTFIKDGKTKQYSQGQWDKNVRASMNAIRQYNNIADLYGTDRIKEPVRDSKRTVIPGPTRNYFDWDLGFESDIKPKGTGENSTSVTENQPAVVDTTPIGTVDGNPITATEYKALQQASIVDDEAFASFQRFIPRNR